MINLKDHDFEGFATALAPTSLNRIEHLKLFAAVFSHGAQQLDDLRKAPQVRASVRDWVLTHGALPKLTVVERRKADDGFARWNIHFPQALQATRSVIACR